MVQRVPWEKYDDNDGDEEDDGDDNDNDDEDEDDDHHHDHHPHDDDKTHLFSLSGFGSGGDGVSWGSSSDELEFLKQLSSNWFNIIIQASFSSDIIIFVIIIDFYLRPGWWSLKRPSPLILLSTEA